MKNAITKKSIIQTILSIHTGKSARDTFLDIIACCAIAFSQAAELDKTVKKRREELYQSYVRQYSPDVVKRFSAILGLLAAYAESQPEIIDILGPVYEGLEAGSKHTGQFFTPQHISGLMAEMVCESKIEETIQEDGYISMAEPSCGAGAGILKLAQLTATHTDSAGLQPRGLVDVA